MSRRASRCGQQRGRGSEQLRARMVTTAMMLPISVGMAHLKKAFDDKIRAN